MTAALPTQGQPAWRWCRWGRPSIGRPFPPTQGLGPVVPTIHWSHVPAQQTSRADFVTQLIATAEYAPQTRSLRRATPADAQAAHPAHQRHADGAGIRTRQII